MVLKIDVWDEKKTSSSNKRTVFINFVQNVTHLLIFKRIVLKSTCGILSSSLEDLKFDFKIFGMMRLSAACIVSFWSVRRTLGFVHSMHVSRLPCHFSDCWAFVDTDRTPWGQRRYYCAVVYLAVSVVITYISMSNLDGCECDNGCGSGDAICIITIYATTEEYWD